MENENQIIGIQAGGGDSNIADLEPKAKVELLKSVDGIVGDLLAKAEAMDQAEKAYKEASGLVAYQMRKHGVDAFKLANGKSVCLVRRQNKKVDAGQAIKFLADNGILPQYQTLDDKKFIKDFEGDKMIQEKMITYSTSEYIKINEYKKVV